MEVETVLERVLGLVLYQPLNFRRLKEARMLMTMTEKAAEKDVEGRARLFTGARLVWIWGVGRPLR